MFWVFYVALEPYVRRRWPQSLISTTRLLRGNWRDPVVGGHVLVGTAMGIGVLVLQLTSLELTSQDPWGGVDSTAMSTFILPAVLGLGPAVAMLVQSLVAGSGLALGLFFLFFLLRVALKRAWIAATVLLALLAASGILNGVPAGALVVSIGANLIGLVMIVRLGLLTQVVGQSINATLNTALITTDPSAWYFHQTVLVLVTVVGLAVWSFHATLGGRRLLR